jgi:transposase-like protein
VREWHDARGLTNGDLTAVSEQLGLRRETLRRWVIEEEVEGGDRPGLTRDERPRIGQLEKENRELLGCKKFASRFGRDALRLVNSAEGRSLRLRGVNARVIVPGTVRTGDAIRKM